MSRQYSSAASSSSRSTMGAGNVDLSEQRVTPTRADIYTSRPSVTLQQQQQIRVLEGAEPFVAQQNQQLLEFQNVRPIIASRSVIINRSAPDPFLRNSRMYHSDRMYRVGASSLCSLQPGAYSTAASSGVGVVMESRDKEKRDMQDLNERLANYLEKARFLEAQNRKLACELERLKNKWGKETSQVKAMYQMELDEARRLLDDAVKDKGKLEIQAASHEDIVDDLRNKLNDANAAGLGWKEKWEKCIQQVADAEAEAGLMRRKTEGMESERERDKKTIIKLQEQLQSTRQDLDTETLLHVEAAGRLQTVEEELAFVKSIHEQEMKEMSNLVSHDTTPDNRAFWKNEMGAALKEIQEMYDDKLENLKTEMETSYHTKVQEFRTGATKSSMETVHSREENKKLKNNMVGLRERLSHLEGQNLGLQRDLETLRQDGEVREKELEKENVELKSDVAKLRAEIDSVMHELQNIMDSKMGLEMEIAAYRTLLEGEEHRLEDDRTKAKSIQNSSSTIKGGGSIDSDTSSAYESSYGGGDSSIDGYAQGNSQRSYSQYSSNRSGDQPKVSFQRSSKGPCGIAESSIDGKFLVIENSGRKEENLGSWLIKREINGRDQLEYCLDDKFIMRPNTKIKIWTRGNKPLRAASTDMEIEIDNWGIGDNIVTKLLSPNREERATYTQKMSS